MDKVSEDINHILAKWDPIRVGRKHSNGRIQRIHPYDSSFASKSARIEEVWKMFL